MIRSGNMLRLVGSALFALAISAAGASAQDKEPFTPERFAELQEKNALILLDVFATWCPTCAQQQKVLAEYREKNPDSPVHTLTIDFDDQKEYVTRFGAPRQSTLILYRGEERLWFSVAETRADVIIGELNKAVAKSRS